MVTVSPTSQYIRGQENLNSTKISIKLVVSDAFCAFSVIKRTYTFSLWLCVCTFTLIMYVCTFTLVVCMHFHLSYVCMHFHFGCVYVLSLWLCMYALSLWLCVNVLSLWVKAYILWFLHIVLWSKYGNSCGVSTLLLLHCNGVWESWQHDFQKTVNVPLSTVPVIATKRSARILLKMCLVRLPVESLPQRPSGLLPTCVQPLLPFICERECINPYQCTNNQINYIWITISRSMMSQSPYKNLPKGLLLS